MGRQAAGVRAIKFRKGDVLTSMDVVLPDADLLVVTEYGYGKRTPLKEYLPKGRATMGVTTLNKERLSETGNITSAKVVEDQDELTIISSGGIVIRTKVEDIKQAGRATMGVRIINLKEGEKVGSVARISAKDLD
jgi:DNA gyrase subunit A